MLSLFKSLTQSDDVKRLMWNTIQLNVEIATSVVKKKK